VDYGNIEQQPADRWVLLILLWISLSH
jgi:hypothetical protein